MIPLVMTIVVMQNLTIVGGDAGVYAAPLQTSGSDVRLPGCNGLQRVLSASSWLTVLP